MPKRPFQLHHIDTSIILEPKGTENGRYCRKYLHKVGYNYNGILSFPVLSELFSVVLLLQKYEERMTLFETINDIVKAREINFYSPKKIETIISKIKEIERRLDPLDTEILACAIENKASVLVTLDDNMLKSTNVQNLFKMRISHPKDLL